MTKDERAQDVQRLRKLGSLRAGRMRDFAQSGAEHSGEASAIRDAWRVEGVRSRYAAVHALRDVDAFCAVS